MTLKLREVFKVFDPVLSVFTSDEPYVTREQGVTLGDQ